MIEIREKVIKVLENMGICIDPSEDMVVLQEYIVDSIQFITFIVNIEEEFDLAFPDEYLSYESISSLDSICQIIYDIVYSI